MVTEERGHCVSIFSSSGRKLRSFGTLGSASGLFNYPCGVVVNGEGNILVATTTFRNSQQKASSSHQLVLVVKYVYSFVILVASHSMQPIIRCMLRMLTITECKF